MVNPIRSREERQDQVERLLRADVLADEGLHPQYHHDTRGRGHTVWLSDAVWSTLGVIKDSGVYDDAVTREGIAQDGIMAYIRAIEETGVLNGTQAANMVRMQRMYRRLQIDTRERERLDVAGLMVRENLARMLNDGMVKNATKTLEEWEREFGGFVEPWRGRALGLLERLPIVKVVKWLTDKEEGVK